MRSLQLLSFITAVLLLASGAVAEMAIKLKDGRTHRLPVEAADIESITFSPTPAKAPAKAAPKSTAVEPGGVLRVGPKRPYRTPAAAAQVATDNAVIEIDAGDYRGDVAVWRQNNLTLRGVGGRPHLQAQGNSADRKAIWVIKGNDVTVDNIEFSGARVGDKNGAGIRFEGAGLTVRNSHFHDNEMGIMVSPNRTSEVLIENSEFNNNTVDYQRFRRLGHNIYISRIKRFTLRNSYIHHAITGHNVKSRAVENYILYNRIMDETGGSSYLLDLSVGNHGYVIGNLFQQSPQNDNSALVSFAAEGKGNRQNPDQALYIVNNTFVNDASNAVFVYNHSIVPAQLINNIFVGRGRPLVGSGDLQNNLVTQRARLKDRAAYDYRLQPNSRAIDQGIDPGRADSGFLLRPQFHHAYPQPLTERPVQGALDLGAFEFSKD